MNIAIAKLRHELSNEAYITRTETPLPHQQQQHQQHMLPQNRYKSMIHAKGEEKIILDKYKKYVKVGFKSIKQPKVKQPKYK